MKLEHEDSPLLINNIRTETNLKVLYYDLYQAVKNNEKSLSIQLLGIIKTHKPIFELSDKYLTKAIKKHDLNVIDFWVKNMSVMPKHLFLALKTSEEITSAILPAYERKNQNKLIDICQVIKKSGGIPNNLVVYQMLFSYMKKLVKITPKDKLIGFPALKRFVEERGIFNFQDYEKF